jgi:hypothetical protein
MKRIPNCSTCHKKNDCLVCAASDFVKAEFCPLVLEAERDVMMSAGFNKPVVFMNGQQPSEIIDIVKIALNENSSFN